MVPPPECLRNVCLHVGPLFQPARPARPADTDSTSGLACSRGLPVTRDAAPSKYLSSRMAFHDADATRKTSAGSSPGWAASGAPPVSDSARACLSMWLRTAPAAGGSRTGAGVLGAGAGVTSSVDSRLQGPPRLLTAGSEAWSGRFPPSPGASPGRVLLGGTCLERAKIRLPRSTCLLRFIYIFRCHFNRLQEKGP